MNVDSQNVCMNGVKRWGGISFVYNLIMALTLVKCKGLGVVMVGLDIKQVLVLDVDRVFSEDDLEIFEVEVVA